MNNKTIPNDILLPEVARLLKEGKTVTLRTRGRSMYPFIIGSRDSVILRYQVPVKVGDIVLAYIPDYKKYVIHRVIKRSSTAGGYQYVLMGDGNISGVEKCSDKDICGLVTTVIRNGKKCNPNSLTWTIGSKIWNIMRRVRRLIPGSVTWTLRLTKGIRKNILTAILLGISSVCLSLLFIWISKQLIDMATGNISQANITAYSIMLIMTILLQITLSSLHSYIKVKTETRFRNHLRTIHFEKAMNSEWDGRERLHSGDTVNRLEEDTRILSDTVCHNISDTTTTLFQLCGAFLFLMSMSPSLAWVVVFILPICLIAARYYGRRLKRLTEKIRATDSRIQSIIQESIQKRVLLLSLMRTSARVSSLKETQQTQYSQVMTRGRFSAFSRAIVSVGFGTGYLVTFLWGIGQLQKGLITFGMLSAFLQLVGQIQGPIANLSRRLPAFIQGLASADRLMELYKRKQESDVAETAASGLSDSPSSSFNGIRFNNVTFRYPDGEKDILSNFSYDFHPGTSTAITGESGTGKSTMMRLMLGILKPTAGSVSMYNTDSTGAPQNDTPASLLTRSNIVYVPQGNSLLSGTIRQNLLSGNPQATDEEINEVLYVAAANFVYDLPQGLDTHCGEGGEGLSEGQAQRIAIARAILSKGQIMLFDEFTSALDSQTEKTIMSRLVERIANSNNTLIFITHRQEIINTSHTIQLGTHS